MRTILPNGSEVDEIAMLEGYAALVQQERGSQIYSCTCMDGSQHHFHIERGYALAGMDVELSAISLSDCLITKERVLSQYIDLNQQHALTTDLRRPLLFVPLPDNPAEVLLIDGWHRVWKALVCGVDVLPAYFLNEAQADTICVMKVPPGGDALTIG